MAIHTRPGLWTCYYWKEGVWTLAEPTGYRQALDLQGSHQRRGHVAHVAATSILGTSPPEGPPSQWQLDEVENLVKVHPRLWGGTP